MILITQTHNNNALLKHHYNKPNRVKLCIKHGYLLLELLHFLLDFVLLLLFDNIPFNELLLSTS